MPVAVSNGQDRAGRGPRGAKPLRRQSEPHLQPEEAQLAPARNAQVRPSSTPVTSAASSIIRKSTRQQVANLVRSVRPSKKSERAEFRVRKLLTPVQVQEQLEVSESWLKRSDIPFIKLGRLRRYDAAVIDAYLTARDTAA